MLAELRSVLMLAIFRSRHLIYYMINDTSRLQGNNMADDGNVNHTDLLETEHQQEYSSERLKIE